jgi:hypothetical protein
MKNTYGEIIHFFLLHSLVDKKSEKISLPPFLALLTYRFSKYGPGSRAERPIPSSAPRGGGMGTPPFYWHTGGGDLYI